MLRWKQKKEERKLAVETAELVQREHNCRHNDEKTQRLDARLKLRSNLVENEKVNVAISHTANMQQLHSVREANYIRLRKTYIFTDKYFHVTAIFISLPFLLIRIF
jgi:hypothetical protein